jgi:hypothetical protein
MPEPAGLPSAPEEDPPSLDPGVVERAYRRERSRRYQATVQRNFTRTSTARFYLVLVLLLFLTVVIALEALHQVQHTFGV